MVKGNKLHTIWPLLECGMLALGILASIVELSLGGLSVRPRFFLPGQPGAMLLILFMLFGLIGVLAFPVTSLVGIRRLFLVRCITATTLLIFIAVIANSR